MNETRCYLTYRGSDPFTASAEDIVVRDKDESGSKFCRYAQVLCCELFELLEYTIKS